MINLLTESISQLVNEKSEQNEYGVSIINLPDFDYALLAEHLSCSRQVELYFLGFTYERSSQIEKTISKRDGLQLFFNVEKAEESRNTGDENTFRVLVVKRQETEKLSSLRWFPEITLESVYTKSCKIALDKLKNSNKVINDLITAIKRKAVRDILGFERVVEYLDCLVSSTPETLPTVMKAKYYCLGLFSDKDIDQGTSSIDNFVKSIRANHNLVERICNLEQSERQSLVNYAANNTDDANRQITQSILKYYRTKDIRLLSGMERSSVENCLKAAKSKPTDSTTPKPKKKSSKVNSTTAASQLIFEDDIEAISDILESVKDTIDGRSNTNKRDKVEIEVGDVKMEVIAEPITERIAEDILVDDTYYGQVIYADVQSPSEAIENSGKYNILNLGHDYIEAIIRHLNNASQYIQDGLSISRCLTEFLESRKEIFEYRKRLQDVPMFPILAERQKFSKYLNAYKKLLDAINEDFRKIWDIAPSDAKSIVSEIMSMDYVFVIGNETCHAMPTPLNPLYLWKYIRLAEEIIDGKNVDINEEGSLSENDKEFIIRKSESIPDPLSVTIIPMTVRTEGALYLPLSGRIGTIPVYSSKRQINQDEAGIDTLQQSIIRYLCLYPHAGMMLKLTIIDPPTVDSIVSMLKGLSNAKEFNIEGVDVSIYKTKESTSDWLAIDDKSFSEGLLGRVKSKNDIKLGFSVHAENMTYVDILESIEQNQHIMIVFDPNEVKIDTAHNNKTVHIHPLCVPKIYTYNPVSDNVEIRPSNEGDIFSVYSSIIEKLNERPSSFSHTSTFFQTPLKRDTYDTMLKKSDWLVILDQSLKNWDISLKSASEKLFYKEDSYRSIGIYSNNCNKFIRGCNDLIYRLGNVIAKEDGVKNIIECIRDLNNDGLLSIISHNSNRIFEEKHGKGSVGLAIAAIQYKLYHPNALLVGLDTQLAKEWLSDREEGLMPDLIGITFDESQNNLAVVDVIEVKTYDNSKNSFVIENGVISGHAVNQTFVLEGLIKEMFGVTEKITTISRREILREQVFESLFQNEMESKLKKQQISRQLNDLFAGSYHVMINKQISYVDFEHDGVKIEKFLASEEHNGDTVTLVTIGQELIRSIITCQIENFEPVPQAGSCEESDTQQITNPHSEDKSGNTTIPSDDIKTTKSFSSSQMPTLSPKEGSSSIKTIVEPISDELNNSTKAELIEKSRCLDKVLKSFNIQAKPINPALVLETARFTRFKIELKLGETIKQIQNRSADIAIQMSASGQIRIEHIKGTTLVAVDIPHDKQTKPIMLLEHLDDLDGRKGYLNILVGQNAENKMVIKDVADMPHLLVSGTTGSGKTVFLHSVIISLMHQYSADNIDFLIIDPKQTDFTFFEGLPNLYGQKVVTDCEEALEMIRKINAEDKETRTELLRKAKCKDIVSYNNQNQDKKIKRLVVIIDEYADLIASADQNGTRKEFESILNMLAQRVRNLGINLIVATQRPSAKIVTGNIKANIPCRVSFRLASHTDSMTILDEPGAEDLLGKGDMIIKTENSVDRLQGLFITEEQLQQFVDDYVSKSTTSQRT